MKSSALFLAIGAVSAAVAAANTAEASLEDVAWDYEVVEPIVGDANDRELQGCTGITIRFSGDSNASTQNSILLQDMTAGTTLYEKTQGSLPSLTTVDSDCINPPQGNLLKLTVKDNQGGYESGYFHALFVGPLRWRKIEGSAMGQDDTSCFRLTSADPFIEDAACDSVSSSSSASDASSIAAVPSPTPPSPAAPTPPFSSRMGCGSGEKSVKVVFKGDQYIENKWNVKSSSGTTVIQSKDYKSCSNNDWQSCNQETVETCLPAGDYTLNFYDETGDGCGDGGVFELYMESSSNNYEKIWGVCMFKQEWSLQFHTKTVQLNSRDMEWLNAHNVRRAMYWFEGGQLKTGSNPYYVPMRWDATLAEQARVYAEQSLADCESWDMSHDPMRAGEGENMAKNHGAATTGYGSQPPADGVLERFVEKEFSLGYGERYHMTQVLWKASRYVGCGDASKSYTVNGNEHQCHVQICRYVAPGNCDIVNDPSSENYDLVKVMADPESQNCGQRFAPDGMYAM